MRLLFALALFAAPAAAEAAWSPLGIPRAQESQAVADLKAKGIEALGWSNAVVEVSAFEGLETVPVAELSQRLTPQDPRWDPWLKEIPRWFHPEDGRSLVWVQTGRVSEAQSLVSGTSGNVPGPAARGKVTPRFVTGWTIIVLTLLFVSLEIATGLRNGWSPLQNWKRWLWAPSAALVLLFGMLLLAGRAPERVRAPETSWLQHRWFQEAWPWGATWKDYEPGKAWAFRSYERREGKLQETQAVLTAPDEAWVEAVKKGRDALSASRIFDSGNP